MQAETATYAFTVAEEVQVLQALGLRVMEYRSMIYDQNGTVRPGTENLQETLAILQSAYNKIDKFGA